jgi:hypothetical protein
MTARARSAFHLLAKPTGAICNLGCKFVMSGLACLDGAAHAGSGMSPWAWLGEAWAGPGHLRFVLRAVTVPLVVACAIDAILQFVTLRTVRLAWALFVGGLLIALPHGVARAVTNRAVRSWRRHGHAGTPLPRR